MPGLLVEAPDNTNLTTLSAVRFELYEINFPVSDDAQTLRMIAESSDQVRGWLARQPERGRWRERVRGRGATTLPLWHLPVAQVFSVTDADGNAIDVADVLIKNPESGIWREAGWSGGVEYTVDYSGGWFVPDDDHKSGQVTVTAPDTISLGGNDFFPAHIAGRDDVGTSGLGDFVALSGFTSGAVLNNAVWRVIEHTDNQNIKVERDDRVLIDDSTGSVKTFTWNTLPGAISRSTIQLSLWNYHQIGRDPAVVDVKLQADGLKFDVSSMLSDIAKLLAPYAYPGSAVLAATDTQFDTMLTTVRA